MSLLYLCHQQIIKFALCGWFKRIFCHHSIKTELKIIEAKSSAIQNNFITLPSVIIAIFVCNTLLFSTIKLQRFSLITKLTRIYNSSNSRYIIEIDYMKQNRLILKVLVARVLQGECFCLASVRFPIYLVMWPLCWNFY